MAESSYGNRVTLAEAVTWIAYGRTKSVDAAKIRKWRRNRRLGRLRHLPKSIQDRLNDAGKKLLAWLIEGRVHAGGFPYNYDGGPKISGSYSEIEIDFLRNGVLCEPAGGMIVTDHTLVDDRSNFVHHHTWGFARVTIDEHELDECIRGARATKKKQVADGGSRRVPSPEHKGRVGAPTGSRAIDDDAHITKAQRLLADGTAKSDLDAATLVAAEANLAERDIDRIRKKLARKRSGT